MVSEVLKQHTVKRWLGELSCSCGWVHETPHLRNAVGYGRHLHEMLEPLFAKAYDEGVAAGYDLAEGSGSWEQVLTYETAHLYDNPYKEKEY